MKTKNILSIASSAFMLLSAFSFLSVSLMAFNNPQSVMDLVAVELNNTDAYSSIRGVYGGVGLTLFISLIYLMLKDKTKGLMLLSLLWGLYALSRITTILMEGALGNFGTQWLIIESVFFLLALTLLFFNRSIAVKTI